MVDFTVVNPTKDSFRTGVNINQPFELGIITVGNPTVGSGTLVTFVSNTLIANGQYAAFGNSGNFQINVTPNGANFSVAIEITGSFGGNGRSFTANASQNENTITLTDINDPSTTVVISQNNGSFLTDGKIDIGPSWVPVTLYIDSDV
ncbi:hypothetical protein HUE56_22635 (plasmid) [Azospirillum oryzae]|uniref:Uncharacterized protein n=1 Tax=Azospirillum oryzae TaxID=286727 RepID=A0A6N1APV2_9PROT|nr:hypothetical protein [Azospirillum oryzae]KAA0586274.1 hypothetical protein FZ938_21570 [Azospirillum oryzae]QKS53328.1 hypothetical protein HUE56_22635 [Azospirillum oryzae]GLR80056.1 hypothetical protein GCM10007856_27320 [Azospirillum oryzae]